MYNPISTYRIQFNKDFTFKQLIEQLQYFSLLGIGTIYASPVFSAVPESMHGYDVVNPHQFNPEIGSAEEFDKISSLLKKLKIGWLQDIVPNHMAFHMENHWLMDVLEHGKHSKYAPYFDIDFDHPELNEKLMVPILGKKLEDAIEQNEIRLAWKNFKFVLTYFDNYFPVNIESIISILSEDISPHLNLIAQKIKNHVTPSKISLLEEECKDIVKAINFDISKLKLIIKYQYYKLCYWQETEKQLNYRRFFTINGLICLHAEQDHVFDVYHSFIGKQIKNNKFQGLRVDHIDGLSKPTQYIEKLRVLSGDETYLVVEKILGSKEELPDNWLLQGSTGYDFLVMVNNLLTYQKSYPALQKFYRELTGVVDDAEEFVYQKKKLILTQSMQGDLNHLCRIFNNVGLVSYGDDSEITPETMKEAIAEFLLNGCWYKLYSDFFPLSAADQDKIKLVIQRAKKRNPSLRKALEILENTFVDSSTLKENKKGAALAFFLRCMQFTGPLMAKGIEDTAMYDYNCFIAHNEVGDAIDASGISIEEFHEAMLRRQRKTPMTMNATSTHDTKRGEDVRARLQVISELPDQWMGIVNLWKEANKPYKAKINGKDVPNANEEYLIYQTLIGVFPFNSKTNEQLIERINEYLVKALREAKTNSNWNSPDETYEKTVCEFTLKILANTNFLKTFLPFHQKIAIHGITNSLNQVILKATCPGIPDFYQGTELWDLSMVDPDNRRPVDYSHRLSILKNLIADHHRNPEEFFQNLYGNKQNGQLKLWLTHLLMKERALQPDLFVYGQYIPLVVTGKYKDNILAYARTYENTWYIIIVPLYTAILQQKNRDKKISSKINWGNTSITLPELAPENWTTIHNQTYITEGHILVSEIVNEPLPLLIKGIKEPSKRKAGILMHITSLPGSYGTGDIGPEAFNFVDFLSVTGQSYWQILPINPVDQGSNYSPYSTYSVLAGNLLLIDPEWLLKYRLITDNSLRSEKFKLSERTNFKQAEEFRIKLLDEAYSNFLTHNGPYLQIKFNEFCTNEQNWLDDYVLYLSLKQDFKGKAWSKWPEKIKNRDISEIHNYQKKHEQKLTKEKFNQFLFFIQWKTLKDYANRKGVKIIGDMSFYVSYDSVEVWQHPDAFKLDKEKNMLGIAGVPPDYFSKTGQFWNMPVYNWDNMKSNEYTWWRARIRKNMEYFDVVRFDHFRGFSAFWEIPASEKNAINGQWVNAPGNDFFQHIKKDYPTLPFIAEDLGDIDEKVYQLRDQFAFPGMRVLQFAFNNDMEKSIHLPHNYSLNCIVYTGTHDNNTTKGWFSQELNKKFKKVLEAYLNKKLNDNNVPKEFIRMAYASVASIAIIPMQDFSGQDQSERLNNPSGGTHNWQWKLKSNDSFFKVTQHIQKMVKLYWRV